MQVFIFVQGRRSCSSEMIEWCKVPEHKQKWSPYIPNILNLFNYIAEHYLYYN